MASVPVTRGASVSARRVSHVVWPGFSTSGGVNKPKSLSTNFPMNTPLRSAATRFQFSVTPANPECRGRRNAGLPNPKSG